MNPEIIKAQLRIAGYTLADVARQEGIGASVVRKALRSPSLAGEKAIAKVMKLPLHVLWPDRWLPDGRRIRPRWAHLYK